jgi:hypothetical protein
MSTTNSPTNGPVTDDAPNTTAQPVEDIPNVGAQPPLSLSTLFLEGEFRRLLRESILSELPRQTQDQASEPTRSEPIVVTQTAPPDYSKLPILNLDDPSTTYPWINAFETALKNSEVRKEEWRAHLLRAPQSLPTSSKALDLFANKAGETLKGYEALRDSFCLNYGPPNPTRALMASLLLLGFWNVVLVAN